MHSAQGTPGNIQVIREVEGSTSNATSGMEDELAATDNQIFPVNFNSVRDIRFDLILGQFSLFFFFISRID